MKTIDTSSQCGLFSAAAAAFQSIVTREPADPAGLAAIGLITAALAPTYQELADHLAATGHPPIDQEGYEAMLASARGFTLTVATAGETQH